MNINQQRFVIHSEVDIVSARMAVREYARRCGLSLKDQACISMAASSMATSLGFGQTTLLGGGEILIDYVENNNKRGVCVRCTKRSTETEDPKAIRNMESSRWLVDDIQVKAVSLGRLEIAITKWDSLYKG